MPKPLFTDSEMVSVRAFAPFEIVEVMALWSKRSRDLLGDRNAEDVPVEEAMSWLDGLGPPVLTDETGEQFGLRVAAAIFRLIKEV